MARRKYTRRKTKKKKAVVEFVTKCDQCSKSFRVTFTRTFGSAFTAHGCGYSVIDPCRHDTNKKVNKWMFFCNQECLERFNEGCNTL